MECSSSLFVMQCVIIHSTAGSHSLHSLLMSGQIHDIDVHNVNCYEYEANTLLIQWGLGYMSSVEDHFNFC